MNELIFACTYLDFRGRCATGWWHAELKFSPGNQVWGVIRIEMMAAFFRDGEILKGERKEYERRRS